MMFHVYNSSIFGGALAMALTTIAAGISWGSVLTGIITGLSIFVITYFGKILLDKFFHK